MIKYIIQGFMLGLAYVAPIGMQNIYVINTAVSSSKTRAYTVALITIFFDITLAFACFFGMGVIMEKYEVLKVAVLLIGALAVTYIGFQLIRSKPTLDSSVDVNKSIPQVILTCFLVTWANPQALVDGSLLLGGFKASLTGDASLLFILSVCAASMTWFIGLTTITTLFKNNFSGKVIKTINIICGSVLIYYGIKLGVSFINTIS